jgi:EpsI family protein
LPISGFALTRLTGMTGPTASLILRFSLAGICMVIGWRHQRAYSRSTVTLFRVPMLALALVGIVLAIQIGSLTRGRETNRLDVSLSYLQGQWSGNDLPVDGNTTLLLGRDHICTRRYHDEMKNNVDVIMTSTGGDRHRAHPPEYCLTGAGWTLKSSDTTTLGQSSAKNFPVARRIFERNGEQLTLLYWFSDGTDTRASYMTMLADDTWRRLRGLRSDWILIRLISSNASALTDFSLVFSPAIRANMESAP